jgi:Transglycosylase SLT domain
MDSGAIRMFVMGIVGILLIVAGISGKLGSILGAIINPEAMNDISQATPGTFSFTATSTGIATTPLSSSTGTPTAVPGNVTTWIQQALQLAGAPASWLQPLQTLVSKESSGDPNAVNPISVGAEHATGIAQMLPGTFREHALPGHTNIFNPVDNLASAIRYIQGRYGSPFNIPNLMGGHYVGY